MMDVESCGWFSSHQGVDIDGFATIRMTKVVIWPSHSREDAKVDLRNHVNSMKLISEIVMCRRAGL
jgi:hypothetical protein